MTSTVFNAITYANKLKEAGMATRIADVQAEEMSGFITSTLVTRDALSQELSILEMKLQGFIVKALITAVSVTISIIGIIQAMLHFMN